MQTIGFIGLGVLGSAITPRLVTGGFEVRGHDLSPAAVAAAVDHGVISTPAREIAATCPIIFTCLPNISALNASLDALLATNHDGQIIVDLSTLSVDDKMRFASRCTDTGRRALDCPVSGNRIMAQNGKLTAFLSGAEETAATARPVIEAFCREVHYVGPFGAGIKTKLCGNILNLVHNVVAAEAMVLAIKSGLDPKQFHDVISGSGSSSGMFEVRGAMMANNNYDHEGMNFSVPIKDARIISDHAASLNCPTPLYHAALQHYYAAMAQGFGDQDAAAVCRVLESAAGATRPATEDGA